MEDVTEEISWDFKRYLWEMPESREIPRMESYEEAVNCLKDYAKNLKVEKAKGARPEMLEFRLANLKLDEHVENKSIAVATSLLWFGGDVRRCGSGIRSSGDKHEQSYCFSGVDIGKLEDVLGRQIEEVETMHWMQR